MTAIVGLFFLLLSAAWAQQPDALQHAASAERAGHRSEALRQYLAFIAQEPNSSKREDALRRIWSIANEAKKQESALSLSTQRWEQTVALAEKEIAGRRRAATNLLQEFEGLAKDLPESKEPLLQLRQTPIENIISLDQISREDDWSKNQMERYLAAIRQELQRLAGSPAADISELHEIQGFFWLYQGEFELAITEWTTTAQLRPQDEAMKKRLQSIESLWKIRKLEEGAKHEFQAGLSHYKAGQYQQAQSRFKMAAELTPSNTEVRRYLKLTQQAMEFASKQEKVQDLLTQARRRSEAGELWEAVSNWADVLSLEPNNEEARGGLSRAGRRLSFNRSLRHVRSPAAQPRLKSEVPVPAQDTPERSPERAREAYSLGVISYTDGDLPAAKEAFQDALHLDPELRKAKQGLEQVLTELKGIQK